MLSIYNHSLANNLLFSLNISFCCLFLVGKVDTLTRDAARALHLVELCTSGSDASEAYIAKPFAPHKEYAEVVLAMTRVYSEYMTRRGKGERQLGDVIKSAASYRHYAYLQNGALFVSLQSPSVLALMPTGATSIGELCIPCFRCRWFPQVYEYSFITKIIRPYTRLQYRVAKQRSNASRVEVLGRDGSHPT